MLRSEPRPLREVVFYLRAVNPVLSSSSELPGTGSQTAFTLYASSGVCASETFEGASPAPCSALADAARRRVLRGARRQRRPAADAAAAAAAPEQGQPARDVPLKAAAEAGRAHSAGG